MRHIILISGKDSLATALVQMAREPGLPYELIFNPTGAELPEVFAWIDRVGAYLGRDVLKVGRSLEDVIDEKSALPSAYSRFCTEVSKVHPLEDYLSTDAATVYYGLRADEPERTGYRTKGRGRGSGIIPRYPLREMGLGLAEVWQLVESRDLLPPAFRWQAVADGVAARLDSLGMSHLLDGLQPWEERMLFSWRSRPNCYFCFFQRMYEWAGLLEHHPDLFERAAIIEETYGAEGFTWIKGKPLRKLATESAHYRQQRIEQVVGVLLQRTQLRLWQEQEQGDLLAVTSCGLYCGK